MAEISNSSNIQSCSLLDSVGTGNTSTRTVSFISQTVCLLPAIPANCIIIYLSLAKGIMENGDFKRFFVNLAFCDLGLAVTQLGWIFVMNFGCWIDETVGLSTLSVV